MRLDERWEEGSGGEGKGLVDKINRIIGGGYN